MAYSTPMSENVCRKVASRFLESRNRRCDTNALHLVNEKITTKDGTDINEYYVYNTPGQGFVIIAGDDSVMPVIGYSTEERFVYDGSMPNFQSWMNVWTKIIASNRSKGLNATAETKKEWDRYIADGTVRTEGDGLLLETALWNQGNPYNICCPKIDGKQALTGCVATAMGILMKYYEWPVAGYGTVPAYTCGSCSVPSVVLGKPYDWKNMPVSLSSKSTNTEKDAVSTLLYHCGVIINAQYGLEDEGTSAYSEDIRGAMVKYMDYDKSAAFKYANMYTDAEWIEMVKNNIRNVGPLIYSGVNPTSGHQFLVTGYDSQDRFYINWGWGGVDNGYYAYPGIGEFTKEQNAIFNLKKNCGGESSASIDLCHYDTSKKQGITLSCAEIVKGIPFTATVECFWNTGADTFNGELGIARVNSSNVVLEVIGSQRSGNLPPNNAIVKKDIPDCIINTDAEFGEKLMCVFRAHEDGEWSICRYDKSDKGLVGEIPLADPFSIDQATSLVYSVEGTLLISSKEGVALKLIGSGGEDLSSAVSPRVNGWLINLAELTPAEYILQLSKNKEFKEIAIKMGLKK